MGGLSLIQPQALNRCGMIFDDAQKLIRNSDQLLNSQAYPTEPIPRGTLLKEVEERELSNNSINSHQ
jgi:hypothetical protein